MNTMIHRVLFLFAVGTLLTLTAPARANSPGKTVVFNAGTSVDNTVDTFAKGAAALIEGLYSEAEDAANDGASRKQVKAIFKNALRDLKSARKQALKDIKTTIKDARSELREVASIEELPFELEQLRDTQTQGLADVNEQFRAVQDNLDTFIDGLFAHALQ